MTEAGVSVIDSRDVRALPEGCDWQTAMRTYHMVVDERFEENNRFALRKYYSPSKIDWSNLPRYNFTSGPSGDVKVPVRRCISYVDHKTGRHVTRNKNFHMSPDTEFVPLAKTKDWILERGGLDLLPDQPEEHKEQANAATEVSLQEGLQALSLRDSVVDVDKVEKAWVSNGHDAGA